MSIGPDMTDLDLDLSLVWPDAYLTTTGCRADNRRLSDRHPVGRRTTAGCQIGIRLQKSRPDTNLPEADGFVTEKDGLWTLIIQAKDPSGHVCSS